MCLIENCSGDVDSVVPVTATRYSLAQLKLTTKIPWYPWYVNKQVSKLSPSCLFIQIEFTRTCERLYQWFWSYLGKINNSLNWLRAALNNLPKHPYLARILSSIYWPSSYSLCRCCSTYLKVGLIHSEFRYSNWIS